MHLKMHLKPPRKGAAWKVAGFTPGHASIPNSFADLAFASYCLLTIADGAVRLEITCNNHDYADAIYWVGDQAFPMVPLPTYAFDYLVSQIHIAELPFWKKWFFLPRSRLRPAKLR